MTTESEGFYRALSSIYDELFPVEATTVEFLVESGARSGNRVLDLACGTGLYANALLELGVDVYGLDGSPDLIDRARSRGAHPDRFIVADMLDLGAPFHPDEILPEAFDLVFCIGNSISHLISTNAVGEVLNGIASRLVSRGEVVIQYVDMSEIDVGASRELPTLTFGDTVFQRRYIRTTRERVTFNAALVDVASGGRQEISNDLLVLRGSEVVDALNELGFAGVEIWGGFDRSPTGDSWVRVVRASALEY